jgi:hypothetical protein
MDQLKDKFIEGFDQSLQVEDPDKYLEIIKADIATAKQELIKSNTDIFGSDPEQFNGLASGTSSTKGFLGKISEYINNAKNEKQRWEDILSACDQTIDRMNQMITEQNKANGEAFAKQQQQQDYMKKRCEILKYGCKDAAWMENAQDIFSASTQASNSVSADPFDKYCSDDESNTAAEDIAESNNIEIQRQSILAYCSDSPLELHSENCKTYLDKNVGICELTLEKAVEKSKYCLSDDGKSIKSAGIDLQNCNGSTNVKPINFIDLKAALIDADKDEETTMTLAKAKVQSIKQLTSCKQIEDDISGGLKTAAYTRTAKESYSTGGYGEHPESKTDCENILASSTGSGDKDEYGASAGGFAGLLQGLDLNNILQQ